MRAIAWLFFAASMPVLAASPVASQPPASAGPSIQIDGALDAADPRDANQRRYEDHTVTLRAGQSYRIGVISARFDPVVQILRPGQEELLAWDDDSGTGTNARAIFTPGATGEYVVRTLAFLPESVGAYRLSVDPAVPLPDPTPIHPPAQTSPDTTHWTTYEGRLSEDDPILDVVHFDDYLITLAAGEELFVRLDSEAFDPLIRIYRADGREGEAIALDDDSGPGRNAFLLFVSPAAGDYVVRVTAFGTTRTRGFVGDYRLRIGR